MGIAQKTWSAYRDAAAGLQPATLATREDAGGVDEQVVEQLLTHSERLERELTSHLDADDPEVRELAALQLEAAAAVDLHQANALGADAEDAVAATLSTETLGELDRILSTPTESGIRAVLDDGSFEGVLAEDAKTLKDTVHLTVDHIVSQAAKAAETTLEGLTGIPKTDVVKALGKGVEETFDKLDERVKRLKKAAVKFVLKAVKKLLAVFGTKSETVREKLAKWLDDLDKEKIGGLLGSLYGVEGLKARYGERIDSVSGGVSAEREAAAREELKTLQAKWRKRTDVIDTIGGLIPFARKWIFALAPPWGGLAYMSVFAVATGYVIFAGGDYLDWREDDGLLDQVDGVGTIVERAVAAA